MGIQDRDYYWENRDIDGAKLPPPHQRFRVDDHLRYSSPRQVESHSPERVLRWLTVIFALFIAIFIGYQLKIDRAEKQAQQAAIHHAVHTSMTRAAESKARAVAQLELQERSRANQLEQKKLFHEKLSKDAERKLLRDAAWERFYRPSTECSADWTVDCANTFIKARNAFAAQRHD